MHVSFYLILDNIKLKYKSIQKIHICTQGFCIIVFVYKYPYWEWFLKRDVLPETLPITAPLTQGPCLLASCDGLSPSVELQGT